MSESTYKDVVAQYNKQAEEAISNPEKLSFFAQSLALFSLEGSPVLTKLQKEKNVSKEEIQQLQLFTANRLAGFWELIQKGKWMEVELFFDYFTERCKDAPSVEPDRATTQRIVQISVEDSV